MPIGKVIKCRTCGRVILRYKKPSYTKEEILSAIRKHYKKYHPSKFREFIKKALKTKRKKGLIDKKDHPNNPTSVMDEPWFKARATKLEKLYKRVKKAYMAGYYTGVYDMKMGAESMIYENPKIPNDEKQKMLDELIRYAGNITRIKEEKIQKATVTLSEEGVGIEFPYEPKKSD